jgi:molybdate transport system substrate-binding protein
MYWKRAFAVLIVVSSLFSCGNSSKPTTSITVHAASSLTEVFTALGKSFETSHPGARVSFDFGASSALVRQVLDGAPGEVIATADEPTMAKLKGPGQLADDPTTFARNQLAIIVAKGNPKGIQSPADLANPALAVLVAAPEVPVGRYATEFFSKAGVKVEPKSLEDSAKAVVTKVGLGEADAGVVFRTDAKAVAGRLDTVAIADAVNVTATYPIAVLKTASGNKTANDFVAFVLSSEGRAVLTEYGFGSP